MNKKAHYRKQLAYFEKEFSGISQYKLAAWQKSYIEKIKKYVIERDFKKKTLIDIGTGSGYVATEMANLGMHVIACDLSPQAIKNLKHYKRRFKLKNLEPMLCKAEKLPLKDKTVDYILANAILEHIPDEDEAIREWKRILKPGGRMFITVPLKFKFIWPFLWPINYVHDKRLGHLRRYDLETLRSRFRLKVVRYFYTGHLMKVLGVLFSLFLKTNRFDKYFEEWDKRKQNKKYGANNISVIFQK